MLSPANKQREARTQKTIRHRNVGRDEPEISNTPHPLRQYISMAPSACNTVLKPVNLIMICGRYQGPVNPWNSIQDRAASCIRREKEMEKKRQRKVDSAKKGRKERACSKMQSRRHCASRGDRREAVDRGSKAGSLNSGKHALDK